MIFSKFDLCLIDHLKLALKEGSMFFNGIENFAAETVIKVDFLCIEHDAEYILSSSDTIYAFGEKLFASLD